MRKQSSTPTPTTPQSSTSTLPDTMDSQSSTETPEHTSTSQYSTPTLNQKSHTSASRTSSSQMSTVGLLTNMIALQTSTNNKIDKLTDAVYGLYHSTDKIHKEQVKQTELLNTIARNTANMKLTISEGMNAGNTGSTGRSGKDKSGNIKDYKFNTTKQVFAEFLIKLLQKVQIEAISRNKEYTSTRDFDLKVATRLIAGAMDNSFKIDGQTVDKINAASTTHPSIVKIASELADKDGTTKLLTPESFREIIEDVDSRYFVSCFRQILERLEIMKVLVPFYESDIISAIEYPYFTKNGQIICDWTKIVPRNETEIETRVAVASVGQRNKIAEYLAKGLSQRAAINAALGSV